MRSIRFLSMPLLLMLAFILAIVACKKPAEFFDTDTGDQNRKVIVKFKDGGDILVKALDAVPTIETFVLIELTRDPNSESDLNQPLTVKLVKNPTLITDHNTAHGTTYVELPAAAYTLSDDPTNITFQPGETTKIIKITLNKTSLNLSNQYALGYSVAEVGSGAIVSSTLKFGLYGIIIKNKYDGHYSVTGTMADYVLPNLTGFYPLEWDLVTTGPNSVVVVDRDYTGTPTHIIQDLSTTPPGGLTQYGAFGLILNFDPVTNKIVSVTNYYGQPAGNTRSAQLDPTGANIWNPATKDIDIKYNMLQPSAVPTPPHIRSVFNEHWAYVGPR